MFTKLKKYIVKKRIINPWVKETKSWKVSDWVNYIHKAFDELKRTKWTKKVFPDLFNFTYDDLDSYRTIDEFPEFSYNYPAYIEWWSSGTVKKKVIKLSKNDIIPQLRALGRLVHNVKKGDLNNALGVTSVSPFATEKLISFGLFFISKKSLSVRIYELDENIDKIIRNRKYDGLVTLVGFMQPLLEKIVSRYDIFHEDLAIGLTGDVLTDSVVVKIEEYLKKWINNYKIHNVYACAEAGIIAVSHTDYHDLVYYPECCAIRILTDDNKLIDIMKAKKGIRGEAVLTIFRELLIPNYNLRDLIEVTGTDPMTGLPTINVLGKKVRRINVEIPEAGEIRGETGAVIRVAGAPLNTIAFDSVLATFNVDYLVLIDDYRLKADFKIYTDRKIDIDALLSRLQSDYITNIWAEKYKLGIVDFEIITDRELLDSYKKLMVNLVKVKRSPKIPRIIVRRHD